MPLAHLCHRVCGRPPCSRPLDIMPTSSYGMPIPARAHCNGKQKVAPRPMPCLLPELSRYAQQPIVPRLAGESQSHVLY